MRGARAAPAPRRAQPCAAPPAAARGSHVSARLCAASPPQPPRDPRASAPGATLEPLAPQRRRAATWRGGRRPPGCGGERGRGAARLGTAGAARPAAPRAGSRCSPVREVPGSGFLSWPPWRGWALPGSPGPGTLRPGLLCPTFWVTALLAVGLFGVKYGGGRRGGTREKEEGATLNYGSETLRKSLLFD